MNGSALEEGPGLYVHVPFCAAKCAYCAFDSRPIGPGPDRAVARYLDAVAAELRLRADGIAPRTLYLGGGTPTALAARDLRRLLEILRAAVDLSRVREATCEANPGTLYGARLDALREAGVNRISLGAQSFRPDRLRRLGRAHSPGQIVEAAGRARAAGFGNLNLDLMFGLPGERPEDWRADLDAALALAPEHLSLYALSIEPDTPLAREAEAGRCRPATDGETADAYAAAGERLAAAGFAQYEISSFARPGFECRHNRLYWTGGEYLGIGPSAHSHRDGVRRENVQGLDAYASALSKGWNPTAFEERLDPGAKAVETLVFALRLTRGVQREELRRRTGRDPMALRGPEIRRLIDDGRLEPVAPDGIRLAPFARFLSDGVFRELV